MFSLNVTGEGNDFLVYDRGIRIRVEQSSILILLDNCQQTCTTYTIAVCTVKNS